MQFIEFLTGLSPDGGSGFTELGYVALLGVILAIAAIRTGVPSSFKVAIERTFRRFS